MADELYSAGVRRINVSMDTLDPAAFKAATRWGELGRVMDGIFAAKAAGLAVKINAVALKGLNEHEYDRMIAWCGEHGFDLTLIDTAAGVHESVTSSLEAADHVVMVITPDPSSIHDAYVTAKTLLQHKPEATIDVVVNQSVSDADSRLMFAKFQSTLLQSMGGNVRLLGMVPWDRGVLDSVRARVPYVLVRENSDAARAVVGLARSLTGPQPGQMPRRNIFQRVFAN
jgi:MinD-like ATPase involved in chromosome partitioning or flagellar assembly